MRSAWQHGGLDWPWISRNKAGWNNMRVVHPPPPKPAIPPPLFIRPSYLTHPYFLPFHPLPPQPITETTFYSPPFIWESWGKRPSAMDTVGSGGARDTCLSILTPEIVTSKAMDVSVYTCRILWALKTKPQQPEAATTTTPPAKKISIPELYVHCCPVTGALQILQDRRSSHCHRHNLARMLRCQSYCFAWEFSQAPTTLCAAGKTKI
ncbi:hypothetical protein RRG08_063058 [Elysia crispata]|uniref:Uncharacterized protein n=1 Tax=Elysia crispata TaxID=231223 RepID=A0AAE0ZIQ7_9GAST|nr:hypothetical protein RRG08_063058 [Elysia crispata]